MHSISIITRDRPNELARCLDELILAQSVKTDGAFTYVVVDDSKDARLQEKCVHLVKHRSQQQDWKVKYFGPDERRTFVRSINHSPELDVYHPWDRKLLDSLDYGDSPQAITHVGVNRNMSLLLSVKESFISVDDDIRLKKTQLPPHESDLVEPRAFPSSLEEDLRFGCIPESIDTPGNDARSVVDELISGLDGKNAQEHKDHANPQLDILLAVPGMQGRRWYSRSLYSFHNGGYLRETSFKTMSTYQTAIMSGNAAMQVVRASVTRFPFIVSGCFAVKGQTLMPPFPPLGRSEDSVFALLVNFIYPNGLTAHLPFMVQHDLGPSKPFTQADFQEIGLDFGTITRLVIQHLVETSLPVEGAPALRRLGERLVELSQIGHSDWLNLTQELYLRNAAGEIGQLEELLERYNEKPSYWARDVHDYIDLVARRGPEIANIHPQELRQTHSLEAAGAFQRSFLRSYGELMIQWPEIWQAALELKESGWTPG